MTALEQKIPLENMEQGRLYRVNARNGSLGVWNAKANGIILIREKFGREYLDTELHYDFDTNHGTAIPLEPLPEAVPDGIRVSEWLHNGMVVCGVDLRGPPSKWREQLDKHVGTMDRDSGPGPLLVETRPIGPNGTPPFRPFFLGTDDPVPQGTVYHWNPNGPLFAWLKEMETKYRKEENYGEQELP